MGDPGRTAHYGEFYGRPTPDTGRPLWLVIGNCQAEALRSALDGPAERPYRTVRVPPVHELVADDLPHLDALLSRTAVLLCQPIRADYRDLPLGTVQLTERLPSSATVVRWPVIRYAGLHPFQVIVRRPADRSVVPPPVPYHDLRTVAAALAGRAPSDPYDVEVAPAALRALAEASVAALADRERRDTDVGVSDLFAAAGTDAAHTINHPGNTVIAALANRILAALDQPGAIRLDGPPLLGSVYAPVEQRVLDALHLAGMSRENWWFHGETLSPERVHRAQMLWYRDNPDFPHLAAQRHAAALDLLGLRS